jgi:O-acetyl-ADP-ribose deacetylase (regulator of RNase III)
MDTTSTPFVVKVGAGELQLMAGDITKIPVDAIVNAANSALAGGGGVDGAIHRAGGGEIMRELSSIRARGQCPAGSAVATSAGLLPAQYVFHAVGPVYCGGTNGEPEKLASCYRTCLEMAAERGLESISFPSISTGIYSYPLEAAATIAIQTVLAWLSSHEGSVKLVKLVQFSESDHRAYCQLAARLQDGLTHSSAS